MSYNMPESADLAYSQLEAGDDELREGEARCEDCDDIIDTDLAQYLGRTTKHGVLCMDCAREREIEQ